MERRSFFQTLLAGAAPQARPERKNRRSHHDFTRLYHGAIEIPEEALAIQANSGLPPLRTTHRHLCVRAVWAGVVYVFRCQPSRFMVGEIIRRPDGGYRVHAWTNTSFGRPVSEVIARDAKPAVSRLAPAPAPVAGYSGCKRCGRVWLESGSGDSACSCEAIR